MKIERQIGLAIRGMFPVVVAASCWLPFASRAEDSQKIEDIKLVGPENLGFFAERVRKHEHVVIGYLGGSITQGCGASQYANNYFWKSWLALNAEIKKRGGTAAPINVAIGGTGSNYGAYRVGTQLLSKNLDLLIVEFAVNDCPGDKAAAIAAKKDMVDGVESIVRQALTKNPKMGIVFLYTSVAGFQEMYYSKGVVTPAIEAHHSVALHYGITEAITGPLIDKGLKDNSFTLRTFFPDKTHPSDVGHDLYAKTLVSAILPGFDLPAPAEPKSLPFLLGGGKYEYARLDPITTPLSSDGWALGGSRNNWPDKVWRTETAGKPFTFKAHGKSIQLLFNGKLKVTWKSGGKDNTKELTGNPEGAFPKPGGFVFPEDANPDGEVVTVEAVPNAPAKDNGAVFGIYYLEK